ncbi:MAG: hypothetical protein F4X66_00045 [Chloroflexi bacterium]|nr:hypothetical protein [Chloroflexota bacterium]MYE42047.1 hypothetical protein [Chloroflexota bacterium]
MYVTRGEAIGFALRTRKNLEYIRQAFGHGEDVHVVTHVVNSLLGIVVVPKERYFEEGFWSISLDELTKRGWPKWYVTIDEPPEGSSKTETLGHLIRHLRNAAAHGRFRFGGEPDSRQLSEVSLIVEDGPSRSRNPNWQAEIEGNDLFQFCLLLAEYIDESIG